MRSATALEQFSTTVEREASAERRAGSRQTSRSAKASRSTQVKNALAKRALACWLVAASTALAQPPQPTIHVTFAEAVQLAQDRNPTVAAAAAGILRAEGLVRQARAATLLQVNGSVFTTTLNSSVEFQGSVVTPQNQISAAVTADQPIVAAAAWARRAQAADAKTVAELSVVNTKRQVALAAADAFLTIIGARRVVEGNVSARDVAKAHFDLATELERAGRGSRLNALRAQQQYSIDEGLVETSLLAVYRAQEALGVLLAEGGPVDAADVPTLELPVGADAAATPGVLMLRSDLKLFAAREQLAARIVRDSSKDWWPSLDAIFQPTTLYPSQFFLPQNSWRLLLQANVPIFDSGQRDATKTLREADLAETKATFTGARTQASAEVRTAREAVASSERSLASARAAASQAHQVVDITSISFRAGASTNIEVIDAERTARDNDLAVAIAEDRLLRARLDLLNALGRFP
jgi:outer membrane protein TolC